MSRVVGSASRWKTLFDHRFEQGGVVADDHQAAAEGLQVVAQPGDGVRVQVVGGLVKQQGLRPGEQDPGQFHPPPLPAGQRLQRLGKHPAGQPQAGGDRCGLGLRRVTAEAVQPFLGVAVAADGRVPAGRVRVGHLLLGGAHRGPDLVKTAGGQHPVHGQAGQVTGPRVLREVADRAGAAHRAARGLGLPRQHPRQCGLARPVPPHQADLVAGGNLEARRLEQQLRARAQFEAACHNHENPLPAPIRYLVPGSPASRGAASRQR